VRAKKNVFAALPSKYFPTIFLDILLGFHTKHFPQRKAKAFGMKSLQALLAHSADHRAEKALDVLKGQGKLEEVVLRSAPGCTYLSGPLSSSKCRHPQRKAASWPVQAVWGEMPVPSR
jgi:hypothetical protein